MHGKFPDYIYKNSITNNISIIEIKTPSTKLVGATKYRDGVYYPHNELSGAVSQVLIQRDTLYKEYIQNYYRSEEKYEALNFSSVLLVGNYKDISSNKDMACSFEVYRNELKNIQVITFDELLSKIKILITLLEGGGEVFEV